MKTLLAILVLISSASVSLAGMVNLSTQSQTIPAKLGNVDNPNRATLLANGWRDMPELPAVANGYERGGVTWIEGDGTNAKAVYTDTLIADRLAAEAAAEATRKATPIVYDTPIEVPSLIVQTTTNQIGMELWIRDDGVTAWIPAHASPMKTLAERRALANAGFAARDSLVTNMAGRATSAKAKVNAANSVPALRAAVLELQAQIDELTKVMK
jgi:hypothetical protein